MTTSPEVHSAYHAAASQWQNGDTSAAIEAYQAANRLAEQILPPPIKLTSLNESRELFTAERYALLQEGGLRYSDMSLFVSSPGDGSGYLTQLLEVVQGDTPAIALPNIEVVLSDYIEAVLAPYQGELRAYLDDLTPMRCHADAKGCLEALEPHLYPSRLLQTSPLSPYLGLLGLWLPQMPVVFCRRDVMDAGWAAVMQPPEYGEWQQENLSALGQAIATHELATQQWASVLPNPIYWVEHQALNVTPSMLVARLLHAWGRQMRKDKPLPEPMPWDRPALSAPLTDALDPLQEGYQQAMDAEGLPSRHAETFHWQLKGRVVVLDNAAQLPQQANFGELMASNSLAMVAFDPASRIAAESVANIDEFQHVPHALLGDGQPTTLYATLDDSLSATLPPLPQQPAALREGSSVLAKLPVNTVTLDGIEGLASLDWLILDERADALAVLENGTRALADTLLLQVRVVFQPTHEGQPTLTEVSHWASRHGFAFYRLHNPVHRSLLPPREDIPHPQATQLANGDALFIPSTERLAALSPQQRQRLAFVLDTHFGIHDLPYQLLVDIDKALAERYLYIRGYTQAPGDIEMGKAPAFLTFNDPTPRPLQTLANMLAEHRFLPAIHLARQQLEKQENESEARYYLGQALSHWGKHQDAMNELATLCSQVKTGTERDLRYRLALGWAQWRAGQTKLAKRTHEALASLFADSLAVQHLGVFLWLGSQKPRELKAAQEECVALLDHDDHVLRLADIGAPSDVRAELIDAKARLLLALTTEEDERSEALALYLQAFDKLGGQQGARRTRLFVGLGLAQRALGNTQAAIDAFWQGCATYPHSLETVNAYTQLRETLGQSKEASHQALAQLHQQIYSLWQHYPDKGLAHCFNDFGLPYQALEPLLLPGSRPTMARIEAYGLKDWLPDNATALDIGCNHGYLLLGLADALIKGVGIDTSETCVSIGNAVAQHLGHSHIQLHQGSFAQWQTGETFDLIIASDVHPWMELPKEDIGERLYALCKPGGVVLFESAGSRDPHRPEGGIEDSATAVASAGFTTQNDGSQCDDGQSQRRFWLLKRPVEAKQTPQPYKARLPIMEGEAATLAPMRHICEVLSQQGAWFHPQLRIHAEGGSLSLHGDPGTPRASYLRVPMALMPHLECFDVTIKGNAFHCQPNGKPLLSHHHEMMESMIELYNVTDKVALWRDSLPFLAWQGEPALQRLITLRSHDQRFPRYQRLAAEGDNETLLVESFIGSRKFRLRKQHLQTLDVRGIQGKRNVLLPVIDCLNHHLDTDGFTTLTDGGEPVMRTFHQPAKDNGELLVRYNYYDAVDTLLTYGFMDAASYWIASAPMTLEVGNHQIDVKTNKVLNENALPFDIVDLRHYVPIVAPQNQNLTRITKLMLCTQKPFSLRRVLTYLVYQLGLAHTELVAQQQVAVLERQVIEQNHAWWQAFAKDVAHLPETHPAQQLCRHSLSLIEQVAQQLAIAP
ncbi:class I SAM-dependent methyltransferase [Vreelandella janggokensis]|uniref:class I SAM-dependent methyltransferase n=1 Tax=Vreelandella janggokensis TaxID=370767 RepID=UPI002867448D|nr:class I SAM-dependent methyltransferase [Halomonas janggokensis]MDR5887794.1 class I SAM-dependent methyltransferase [Halomonas janggokensis]